MRKILPGLVVVATVALASGSPAEDVALVAPAEESANGVSWRSGGVGTDEREALLAVTRDYNLKLTFAEKDRPFLSNIAVVITDGQGKAILEAVSNGPWFFAKLPPGRYRVSAARGGKALERPVEVAGTGQTHANFYWD